MTQKTADVCTATVTSISRTEWARLTRLLRRAGWRIHRYVRPLARTLSLVAGLTVCTALLPGPGLAQPAQGKFPVLIRGQSSQSSLKVDTSTTGNTIEAGCEKDQIGGLTVNGLTIQGGPTGTDVTIAAKACTGGDANSGITLTPLGTGTVKLGGAVTTFVQFYPAVQYCNTNIAPSTAANLIPVRLAANDWALARTSAGAETYILTCAIPLPWRTTASKGARVDSFSISQFISVVALTSNAAPTLSTNTYVNNVANAVAGYGGAITITQPTATQANPYLTAAALGTPAFMTTAATAVNLDWTVVMANTGVYRLYGIAITWTLAAY